MASAFHIFEDTALEKENLGLEVGKVGQQAKKGKDERPTRTVLGDKKDVNIDAGKAGTELGKNLVITNASKKEVKTFKSTAPSQGAFQVFEDEKKVERLPLQEMSPMSTGKSAISPMSIDKSILSIEGVQNAELVISGRSDLERFFEVEEYQTDILAYLKSAEMKHRPKSSYMRKQPDITHSMRTILVDWLVEVGEEYRLQNETLYLAVSYIDRFLSYMSVVRAKLQLVGTSAMFIAAKFEEIYPPDVGEFVYITDDTYNKSQVLRMEQLILKVLSFDLSVPTSLQFTTLICTMHKIPENVKHLAMYFSELSLLEAEPYLQFIPSQLSAASLALACFTLELPMWPKSLEESVGYKLDDLKEIIVHLGKSHEKAAEAPQQAIQEKYKSSKYSQVASLLPRPIDESSFIQVEKEGANENVRQMISSLVF